MEFSFNRPPLLYKNKCVYSYVPHKYICTCQRVNLVLKNAKDTKIEVTCDILEFEFFPDSTNFLQVYGKF